MPGETATQQLSFGHHSPSKMYSGPPHSYEIEMGVSPEAFAPVFQFRKRYGEINWRKVAMIDVDKVARELDIDLLQEHIQTVAFCNIDAVSDLDPMFSKLFKLSQYMIEYLLHSQSSLQGIITELERKLEIAAVQQNSAQDTIKELEGDIHKLKVENKKRRKMIEQQQMLIESGASSYYKCPHCEKAFMNASFLQGHMQRKHPGSVNYIGDVIAHSQREQSKLAGRLQDLDSDLQRERLNFTEQLKKAEEEKAAWGARTRRDMNRWKKEEEGKWRKELEEMKKSFVDEIQHLKAQETEYKKKITSLQITMDERHSNLGDLVDDIAGEKQKLTVYEERIKSLERTNADKDDKLRRLAAEMANLKDQSNRALSKHQQDMAATYGSQLKQLKDQVNKRPKEIVPVVAPLAAEPAELSEESESGYEDVDGVDRDSKLRDYAKRMRPHFQQMLDMKLQQCGVDPNAPGISVQTLTNKLMVRKTERQRIARNRPGYFRIRDEMRRKMEEEAAKRRGSPPRRKRGRTPSHLPKQRQYSPSPVSAPTDLYAVPQKTRSRPVVPAGRLYHEQIGSHAPSPMRKQDQPMTRDELDTRHDEDDDEDSPWDSEISGRDEAPPVTSRKERPTPSAAQRQTAPRTPVAARIPTSKQEDDSWDSDELENIVSPDTDVRDIRPKSGSTKIQQLGANLESKLQARSVQKPPAGAVDVLGGGQPAATTQAKAAESDEDDFSLISSLNESPKPAPRSAVQPKVRQSTATVSSTGTMGTSVWGSGGQGKPPAGKVDADEESDWDDISDL